jgi:hypothetical protein
MLNWVYDMMTQKFNESKQITLTSHGLKVEAALS